ncbi:MAG: FAD-dependent oxidoreductase [Roseibium sp.]|uniref:NAD(P)/FAD-dependent oxidoreductase n=1 Tax=Roseibium sp. TaxID=1936156 RepID=UPI002608624B|nr:FAD-dependent oxidoreductase [Roseibium sp.]MCV0429628.1 FAD-dependent oxidoreductase [Roseibium sp.]
MSKRIVIVGGGNLGSELARSLETEAEVTLIEQAERYVHAPAMIRAVVDPKILDKALIPYENLLSRGKFVRGQVTEVDASGVTLADGSRVDADYIVLATGSSNSLPFKPTSGDVEALKRANHEVHEKLLDAKTIAIVGGGAVGIELAGELAHAMPEKEIVLVSDKATLMPGKPANLGRSLEAKLKSAGVEIIFGARGENLENSSEPYAGTVRLTNGRVITADLIFPVIGSRANSALLTTLPDVEVTSNGRVASDGWMRPSSLENVFAAGDVADNGDAMTIVAVSRQVPWLTKTLKALLSGKPLKDIKPYVPWKSAPILLPLGPVKGNSFLVLFTAGNWITRKIKGTDLFLTKYNKAFGRK